MEEIKGCASRKRGNEHKIETRKDEVANCVTSIDPDSMVCEPLKIPQATRQGYIECPVGGVFDASYPDSDKRRGRVQENGEVSPTLTTNSVGAILTYEGKAEASILTPLRTEEGKQLRKQGIEKFSNRALYPREDGVSNTITSVQKDNLLAEPKPHIVGHYTKSEHNASAVLDPNGISPTVMENHGTINAVVESTTDCLNYYDKTGNKRSQQDRIYNTEGISTAIITSYHSKIADQEGGVEYKGKFYKEGDGLYSDTSKDFVRGGLDGISRTVKATMHDAATCVKDGARYRIRKLTEREVFRLMDVSEEDIDKIQAAGISKTAQYKLAGNSIVVNVLYHIFRKMFIEPECEEQQLSLF